MAAPDLSRFEDPGDNGHSTRTHVTSSDPAEWADLEALLRSRGLDPDEWVIVAVRVQEWSGMTSDKATGDNRVVPMRNLRVDLAPRSLNPLLPARSDGWRPPPRAKATPKRDTELVVFFGDHHAPHHDPDLHASACEWLRKNKPDRGVICGDLLDYDAVSRHRKSPRWSTAMNEGIQAGYDILRAYVQASPGTEWTIVDGNHEDRLRNSILDHLPGLYGIRRAHTDLGDGEDVLSVRHLLRLDELGVTVVTSEGDDYSHAQVRVSPHLAACHGWISRKGSGASAIATLEALRYSVFIGHCHRQAMVSHTAHDIDGTPHELIGVEIGTMAKIRGGLGYVKGGRPDWQQGFATARIWPDHTFTAVLAKFSNGSLVWADQRFDTAQPGTAK